MMRLTPESLLVHDRSRSTIIRRAATHGWTGSGGSIEAISLPRKLKRSTECRACSDAGPMLFVARSA